MADKPTEARRRPKRLRRPSLRWTRRIPRTSPQASDVWEPVDSPGVSKNTVVSEGPAISDTVQFIAYEPRWLRRAIISLLAILTIYTAGLWLFGVTGHFLFLILVAWLIAISMEPPIRYFERRGMKRGLGTGITMFVGTLITAVMLIMLGGVFSSQSADLISSFPSIINEVVAWLNSNFELDLDATTITQQLNVDASTLASLASDFAGGIVGALGVAFAIVFDVLTVLVFAFFIAADGPKLRRTIASWLPPAKQRVMITVWDISLAKTGGFVVSKVILASISALAHAAFFWFIDLPFWLPMGIFAGFVGQLIPTIGTYLGVVVPVIIGALDRPILAVWIVVFATVYQQIENYVLTPRVSRATMNIHPAVALAAVFVGAAIWGPMGALIGIPLAAAIISVIDTYGHRYELISEMQESVAGPEPSSNSRAEHARDDALRHAAQAVGTATGQDMAVATVGGQGKNSDFPTARPADGTDTTHGPGDVTSTGIHTETGGGPRLGSGASAGGNSDSGPGTST